MDQVFDVDLKAAFLCAKHTLPSMIERGSGAIVNIASLHAKLTCAGMYPYAAAKSGLVGLTRSMALEVAPHGVRVNAVSPGYIRTALVDEYFDQNLTGTPSARRSTSIRWAASAPPRRSPKWCASSRPTRRPSSPGRSGPWTAGSACGSPDLRHGEPP